MATFRWRSRFVVGCVALVSFGGSTSAFPSVIRKKAAIYSADYNSYTTQLYSKRNAIPSDSVTEEVSSDSDSDKLLGSLVLLTVPLSWGTYSPVVRYLYNIDPPVPGFVFSACYYALAAVTTLTLAQLQERPSNEEGQTLPQEYYSEQQPASPSLRGGIELGSYLFVANCLQVVGLQTVQADRAGFLVQLTTVMVPLTEALLAGSLSRVPLKTWLACVVAFFGLCVMGLDGKDNTILLSNPGDAIVEAVASFSQGDGLILGAAILYTLHVVRLGTYATQTTPMKLAASKSTTETVQSIGLIALLVGWSTVSPSDNSNSLLAFAASTGQEISDFFVSFSAGLESGSLPTPALASAVGAIFWTGWVTCAYTIWAQSYGQSKVSPTNANLIYTFQPIFTSLFAYLLLGETMGPAGFVGGALIASAVYAVAEPLPDGNTITGRSSSASHFSKDFKTASAGAAEDTFYGITLSNSLSEATSWGILALIIIVVSILLQPKRYHRRPIMRFSFWIALLAVAFAAPQATLVPLLTNIIYTRTTYPYMVVVPHCIVSAATYRLHHGDNVNRLQSLLLTFLLYGFGGSIVSDILMGLPATALSHPRIIPSHLLGWLLVWFSPWDWVYQSYKSSDSAFRYVLDGCEAVDAVTTPMGRVSRSARELRNKTTAPIIAGLLAGVGGGGVRLAVREPSSSLAALEGAFWKTLSYSVLWWWLAVYQCGNEKILFHFDHNWNHCGSYNGADLLRVVLVTAHTIWMLLAKTNVVKGHPLVWLCRKVFIEGSTKVALVLHMDPTAEVESNSTLESKKKD